jgi:hypothetical protein
MGPLRVRHADRGNQARKAYLQVDNPAGNKQQDSQHPEMEDDKRRLLSGEGTTRLVDLIFVIWLFVSTVFFLLQFSPFLDPVLNRLGLR